MPPNRSSENRTKKYTKQGFRTAKNKINAITDNLAKTRSQKHRGQMETRLSFYRNKV